MIADDWPRPARRLALPRRSARLIALLVLWLVLLGCAWLWFRDSSLVRIRQVTVTGLSGPDVGSIRQALISAAGQMTTLDVDMARLDSSVSAFADVRSLSVTTHFPHAAEIHVNEQVPVAAAVIGGRRLVIDSDGAIITPAPGTPAVLPTIPLRAPPAGLRLTAAGARAAVATLAAAPYELLAHIDNATSTAIHGVIVQLRNGPQIYFGPASGLGAKWSAAIAVLGDPTSEGATYIDVSDPTRPAAGGRGSSPIAGGG